MVKYPPKPLPGKEMLYLDNKKKPKKIKLLQLTKKTEEVF